MNEMIDGVFGFFISEKFYLPIFYIAIGIVVYNIISYIVVKALKVELKAKKADKKKATMITLFKNIIKYVIAIFIILAVLEVYDVNTSKILASIGIIGAVIGLAFQDMFKDLIAGFFIIFDNEYAVGDTISINGFRGEVLAIGLKNTKIKSYTGEVKIIANSSFTEVINYNMALSKALIEIPVSYDTNISKLETVLEGIKKDIEQIENVRREVELLGVTDMTDSAIIYLIGVDCLPMCQYGVKRKVLRLVKETLDKNKIEIPYNKLDVFIKK